MAYSASIVALAFVKNGIEDGNPVTQMKLQKLVYVAHGLYLAKYEDPLIIEKFQAWKFGPVVPAIYHDYKLYGSAPILDIDLLSLFKDINYEKLTELDERAYSVIKFTWGALKDASASQLSNWTHRQGSPWQKCYVEGVSDVQIPNDEIQEYFKQYLVAA